MLLKCLLNSVGELNMLPTEENYNKQRDLIEVKHPIKVLKKALILKKNEKDSGFVSCFKDARKFVVTGYPLKCHSKINRFEVLICIGEDIYNYGFKIDNYNVEEEWLYVMDKKGIFRKVFDFKEKYSNKLFLYRLAKDHNFKTAKNVITWFKNIEIFPDYKNCDLMIIKDINSKPQQILFESDNVNLLDYQYFNHDEIWLVGRFANRQTNLRPLSDFEFNSQANIKKDYKAGRYGV